MTRTIWSERIGPGYLHCYEAELLYEERTKYQHMVLFHNPLFGRCLVLDGIVQLTQKDEFIYHEMFVHCPFMGLSSKPESVLIIGGADGGVLREVLTYQEVKRVVHVEIDEAVLKACKKYLPEVCGDWNDPRVELIIGDGAKYVKEAKERGEKFDCILLDSTDPVGPAIVLFEPPFHKDLFDILNDGGVVVRQSGLPLTMPKVMPFVFKRFQDFFPTVEVYRAPVPTYGDEMAFVAATKGPQGISKSNKERIGRFYNPKIHEAAFALPTWWIELIDNFEDTGEVPIDSLY